MCLQRIGVLRVIANNETIRGNAKCKTFFFHNKPFSFSCVFEILLANAHYGDTTRVGESVCLFCSFNSRISEARVTRFVGKVVHLTDDISCTLLRFDPPKLEEFHRYLKTFKKNLHTFHIGQRVKNEFFFALYELWKQFNKTEDEAIIALILLTCSCLVKVVDRMKGKRMDVLYEPFWLALSTLWRVHLHRICL